MTATAEHAQGARDWYAKRSPQAARGFLLALEAAISAVTESPERWPLGKRGCRLYVFSNQYPFTLVYRLEPKLEIVAVAHQKRHPEYWTHR